MSNKGRKRELKAAFKAKELETLEASMPLSKEELRGLFDYLDSEEASGCDHTATKKTGVRAKFPLILERTFL